MSDPESIRYLGLTEMQVERLKRQEQARRDAIDLEHISTREPTIEDPAKLVPPRPLTGPRAFARSMLLHPALDELARVYGDSPPSELKSAISMARYEVARVDAWLAGGKLPWTTTCFDFDEGTFDVGAIDIIRIVFWCLMASGFRATVQVTARGRVRMRFDHQGVSYNWRPESLKQWTVPGGMEDGMAGPR